jgi:hypothetical protein
MEAVDKGEAVGSVPSCPEAAEISTGSSSAQAQSSELLVWGMRVKDQAIRT